jgi:gliding motility-associated-like protein
MYFSYRLLRRLLRSSESAVYIALCCCAFSVMPLTSFAQLNANFTMSKVNGCAPLYVTFTNTSAGFPDSCFWELGINGNTSDECSPSAIFNQPGVYQVKLTVFKGNQSSNITKTVTVFKDPVANFDAAPRTGCVPFNVQFTDLSVPGDAPVVNWLWDMGDGRTETTKNPLHTYTFSGNLTVSLIVTDGNGCKNTLTVRDFIKKATAPSVDFTVNKSQTCLLPFNAAFQSTVTSTSPVTYTWNFGNGGTSTDPNPTYAYTAAGNYTVSLSVKDQNNCVTTRSIPNAVKIEKFVLNASVPNPVCTNQSVNASVSSNYFPVFCNWDFGDGRTSNAVAPTISYTSPGTYNLSVKANNLEGCRDSMQQQITVNLAPEAAFAADKIKSCVPYTVNLTNSSVNGSTYRWEIRGPQFHFEASSAVNPSFYLPRNGSYDVTLIVTSPNGCVDRLDMPRYLWVGPDYMSPSADITEGCTPLRVQFNTNLTTNWTPRSISWDFGDGTFGTGNTPVHVYTTSGNYMVKVKVLYDAPCDSLVATIGPIKVGDKVPFDGTFDLDKVCVNREEVTYTATGGRPTTEFIWIFGDGVGQGRNTTHIYQDPSQPGTYSVQLIAINNTCRDTLEIGEIFVGYPKAKFNYTATCNSQTVTFENLSEGHTSATWDFGDGTTSTSMSTTLTHTYAAGITEVTATLVVYNDSTGCRDTLPKTINFASVDSSFRYTLTPQEGCAPLKVMMTAPSDTSIRQYIWELGNGDRGFGNNFLATYPAEGKFAVKLFVRYNNNCLIPSPQRDTVTVIKAHSAFDFDKSSGCIPAVFNFTDKSYSNNSPLVSYSWLFNNTGTASGRNVSYAFNSIGTFPVKLTVVNEKGCVDSLTRQVTVSEVKADFDIDVNDVCAGKPIRFLNRSSSNAVSYLWDFGDGTTSTEREPTHAFPQERNYTIKLTVSDGTGCENTMTKANFVRIKNIHVNFNASPTFKTCPDLITNFQLQAPAGMQFNTINWDFGNGNTSNDNNRNPQGVYTISDSFDVRLIVVDTNNCTDTIFKPNYIVVAGPQGSFDFQPDFGCAPFNVTFNAQFKNTTTTIWDFGNGDTRLDNSLSTQTTYTYRREGEYTPSLVLKDNFGCTVNIISTKKINVARLYTQIGVDRNIVCDGSGYVLLQDSIYSTPNSPISNYYWTITDSLNNTIRGRGDTFLPPGPGAYELKFYTENTFGCVKRDSVKVGVYTSPVITGIRDKLICRGEQIPLKLIGNPTVTQWTPANSLNTSTGTDVIARPDTTTTYVVKAYHHPQCPVYDTVTVEVKSRLNVRAYPDTILCIGDTIQLHTEAENTSLNQTKITWSASPSLSNVNDPNPFAFPKTNTIYYAVFENGACLMQKIPVKVDIKPLPTVTAGQDHIIIKGSEVQLDATSPNQVNYVWSPDYKLSCTGCQTPMASPETDTVYMVTAINEFGCKATDDLRIQVIEECSGKMVYVPNTFSPNGDGQNDVLRALGPGVASVKLFRVFNRWGQMVFDTADPNFAWDGTFKGALLNPGVYVYYMDVECINGQRTIKKGDVTLLK